MVTVRKEVGLGIIEKSAKQEALITFFESYFAILSSVD